MICCKAQVKALVCVPINTACKHVCTCVYAHIWNNIIYTILHLFTYYITDLSHYFQ